METRNIFLPNYSIGENPYTEVPSICEAYGKKVVFIGGKTALAKASDIVKDIIKNSTLEIIDTLWFGGEACYENVEKLKQEKSVIEADMVFVFGGGKAIDTCKCLTGQLKKLLQLSTRLLHHSTSLSSVRHLLTYYV